METVVVAIGGSVLAPATPVPGTPAALAKAIAGWAKGRRLYLIAGGGKPARDAIAAARELCKDETELDRVGIRATRLNAAMLRAVLRGAGLDVANTIPTTAKGAARISANVIVMGGTTPGHSTDHVAADVARLVGAARVVIATNVDGVYSADPRGNPDATMIAEMTYDELKLITGTTWSQAGQAGVVDGPAAVLLSDSGLECRVASGMNLDNLSNAVTGKPFKGTVIREGA